MTSQGWRFAAVLRRLRRGGRRELSHDQFAELRARQAFRDLGTTCAQDAVRRTERR